MKIIIRILGLLSVLSFFILFQSCEDYLEKPPSVDITADSVYNNIVNAEKALNDAYTGLPFPIPYDWDNKMNVYAALLDELTDIATEREDSWGGALNWYNGNISIANYNEAAGDDFYKAKEQWFPEYYVRIRKALLVVRNIDRVPDADASLIRQMKAEAKLIAGINYYQMFKNYGAVPFINHALEVNESTIFPRPTLQAYKDSMLAMLNECVDDLPSVMPPLDEAGRLTKAAALGMIARVHWFAASPLFNSDQPAYPYPESDPDRVKHNSMICFMKEDPQLWITAAEACKSAIDEAEAAGFSLLATGDYGSDFNNDYYNVFSGTQRGQPEVIIGTHAFHNNNYIPRNDVFSQFFRPNQWTKGVLTHNLVEMYDMSSNGLPQDDPNSNFDPKKPYEGLDTRFYETVVQHGSRYSGIDYRFDVKSSYWINYNGRSTGYLMRKFHPRNSSEESIWQWPYLRLADLYLMYAECLNEAYGPSHADIYTYIGKVRARAGTPNIPTITNKELMRERILKERAVELSLENSRYFDLRRWKRYDVYKTTIWAAEITDNGDETLDIKKFDYPLKAIGRQRAWKDHWILFPFPRQEVMKGYGLVQNPGWDDDNLVGITLN